MFVRANSVLIVSPKAKSIFLSTEENFKISFGLKLDASINLNFFFFS